MPTPSKAQVSKSIIGANLPAAASQILISNISAETIAGGQGVTALTLDSDFVTLVLIILDMTGSMSPNRDAVVKSYKEMIESLKNSKAAGTILVSTWVFNSMVGGKLLHSYLPLELVPELTAYDPDHETNLYDTVLDGVTSLLQYEHDLNQAGTRTQSVIVPFTDGMDNASRNKPEDLRTVIEGLLTKEKYVFSLVGFGSYFDPHEIARVLGIPDANVLSVGSTAHDVRLAMGTVSKSVIRTSQTTIGSSQGGFFNPK